MKLITTFLLLPTIAIATEAQLGCDLERSRAEVQASILASPNAYALANDTSDKEVTIGLAQSLSGRTRARLIREAAEARCDSIRYAVELETHSRFAVINVRRLGAIEELNFIEKAIALSKTHIAHLDLQLKAQTITITEHTQARQTLVNLEQRQVDLLRILSQVANPTTAEDLTILSTKLRDSEALAANLTATAQAEAGWDVKPSIGVRQPIGGDGSTTAFVGLSATYSFGYSGAKDAASRVKEQTRAYLAAQGSGYTQTLLRQQLELKALVEAETIAASTSARQVRHLEQVLSTFDGIDTALANNARRAMQIQLLVLQAEATGAETRATNFKKLLDQLKAA